LQQIYLNRLLIKLLVTGSTQFIHHVLSLPIEFFTQRHAGDISNRAGLNDTIAVFLSRQLASALLAALLAGFYCVMMLLYSPQQIYLNRLLIKLLVTGSTQFIHHVLSLPIEFFTQRHAGDISNRAGLNDTIAVFLSRQLASALLAALLAGFYCVMMLLYSPL